MAQVLGCDHSSLASISNCFLLSVRRVTESARAQGTKVCKQFRPVCEEVISLDTDETSLRTEIREMRIQLV